MKKEMVNLINLLEMDKRLYEIFRECPYDILRQIRIRRYGENEFALDQEEIHDTFYIIVNGTADIYVESEQGKKYFLTQYTSGQYIGELEIFGQHPYVSRVESKGKIILLEIDREIFLSWIRKDSNFSGYLIRTLSESSYNMCKNMGENALYSLKQRICQFLIDSAEQSHKMEIPMRTEMLGSKLAVTQRSVNRVIKQLKEKEIIELSRCGVVIKDYDALLSERDRG